MTKPETEWVLASRNLLVSLSVALSEGRSYAEGWTKHSGSINGREFSQATAELADQLRALLAPPAPSSPVGEAVREWQHLSDRRLAFDFSEWGDHNGWLAALQICSSRMAAALTAQAMLWGKIGAALNLLPTATPEQILEHVTDWKDDALRLHREKMNYIEIANDATRNQAAAESALTTARGALESIQEHAKMSSGVYPQSLQSLCNQIRIIALAALPTPSTSTSDTAGEKT